MITSTVGAPNREVIVIDNAPSTKDKPTTTGAPGGESIQGTGTQNRLTKWGDNAGTVVDAEAAEVSGLTIFGQNSSGQVAPLFPTASTAHVLEVGVAPGARSPLTLAGGSGVMEFWKDLGGGTGAPAAAVSMGLARPGLAATNDMIFSTYMPGPSWNERMRIASGGNVGIGTNNPGAKLDVNGDLNVTGNAVIVGNIAAKYQDVAEWVDARQAMDAGTVVSLDVTRRNSVRPSRNAYDSRIAGVVTAQPGVILGEAGNGKVMVTMSGRVRVKVDATKDPIRIGDLLVASNKSGMAMRSRPIKVAGRLIHRPGTIIGKALEALPRGKGNILVLVSLQ
jgi:hypothetical protein